MSLPPMPVTELSMKKQFQYVKLSRELDNASKEQLVELCSHFIKRTMLLEENVANLVKNWGLDNE